MKHFGKDNMLEDFGLVHKRSDIRKLNQTDHCVLYDSPKESVHKVINSKIIKPKAKQNICKIMELVLGSHSYFIILFRNIV